MLWTDLKPLARFKASQPDYKPAKAQPFLVSASSRDKIQPAWCASNPTHPRVLYKEMIHVYAAQGDQPVYGWR